jgi:hypothetical protein
VAVRKSEAEESGVSQDQARIARVLAGFRAASSRSEARMNENLPLLRRFLDGYRERHSRWEVAQRAVADDFNLFRVMDIEHIELIHSKLLAWLLDQRIEHGSHAQGNLGFRLFIREFQTELDADQQRRQIADYADEDYRVRREVASTNSRVDIEIAANGRFLIHIENKILAVEGEEQTIYEWTDMNKRADALEIPESSRHAIFLTLGLKQAKMPRW